MKEIKPLVAITIGDPAGIGPEISVTALSDKAVYKTSRPLLIGERSVVERALRFCNLEMEVNEVSNVREGTYRYGAIDLINMKNIDVRNYSVGRVDKICGRVAYEYIEKAASLALAKEAAAVATAPINKEALRKAGIRSPGHTEILAELTGVSDPLTMFEVENLRIFFLTRHVSLIDAIKSINKQRVMSCIERCIDALNKLGTQEPLLAVAGLNPHSGEGGLFGDEELKYIIPAIDEARARGYRVDGPLPADSVFHLALQGKYSAVLSLYHDQGHIAAKTLDFHNTISITLGLPFLRTSPDHGTAFNIAGKGTANVSSMKKAIMRAAVYSRYYDET
jgi:4-hydroxythreonine-4-phosphate dehydrogenase